MTFVAAKYARLAAYSAVSRTLSAYCTPTIQLGHVRCSVAFGSNKQKVADLGCRAEPGEWVTISAPLFGRVYGHTWEVICDSRAEIDVVAQVDSGRPEVRRRRGFVEVDAYSATIRWRHSRFIQSIVKGEATEGEAVEPILADQWYDTKIGQPTPDPLPIS